MLHEFEKVGQIPGCYRRLFTDEYFDLFIWYNKKGGKIIGFQLCYDKDHNFRALTWEPDRGCIHTRIDEGESLAGRPKKTPILVQDGIFDKEKIAENFRRSSTLIESDIADLVFAKILEYK